MSIPISICTFVRAYKEERVFEVLVQQMECNVKHKSMLLLPCICDPPCTLTDEQLEELGERLEKAVMERYKRGERKEGVN